jgi:hypothetical protein
MKAEDAAFDKSKKSSADLDSVRHSSMRSRLAAGVVTLQAVSGIARAQTYPSRPIAVVAIRCTSLSGLIRLGEAVDGEGRIPRICASG